MTEQAKICALFCSCSVCICYTTVTHLLSNINPHLLGATTSLFLSCLVYSHCKVFWEELSPVIDFCNVWEKYGFWLLCGILAAGKINQRRKKKENTASYLLVFFPACISHIYYCVFKG